MEMRNDKPYCSIGDGSLREACPFDYEDTAVLQNSSVVFLYSLNFFSNVPSTIFSIPNCFACKHNALDFVYCKFTSSGPSNSVGLATDYGLDGPGSNPGGDEIFRRSRPALWPTQPPVQWVPGLFRG